MADSIHGTDEAATTNTQNTHNVLLKRNPHLRVNDTLSPDGGLGARQLLQKQLMTPDSATSASSFEESTPSSGFSDSSSLAIDKKLAVKTESVATHYVSRTGSKQPTKKLSPPSRDSLVRSLDTSSSNLETSDLLSSNLLTNLVIKTVPSLHAQDGTRADSMVPLSPRSSKVTRRIVASPRKTVRRVVLRKTDAEGQVHEHVQYLDEDGRVVQQNSARSVSTDSTTNTVSDRPPVTSCVPAAAHSQRRVVVRRTGVDGQVHHEVQYLDADGTVIRTENQGASTVSSASSSTSNGVTRQTVSPNKATRRNSVQTASIDGQGHDEVKYVDVYGDEDVASMELSDLSPTDQTTKEGLSQRKVIRRVVRRTVVREDGTSVAVDPHSDVESYDGYTFTESARSFADSTSSVASDASTGGQSRRVVTRRVVAAPGKVVRRTVVQSGSSSTGTLSEGNRQTGDTKNYDFTSSGGVSSGRRMVTRRVVTPQRIVRRMVVRKELVGSEGTDDLDVDTLTLTQSSDAVSREDDDKVLLSTMTTSAAAEREYVRSSTESVSMKTNDFEASIFDYEPVLCTHAIAHFSAPHTDKAMVLTDLDDDTDAVSSGGTVLVNVVDPRVATESITSPVTRVAAPIEDKEENAVDTAASPSASLAGEDKSDEEFTLSHRKTGHSIWQFWGANSRSFVKDEPCVGAVLSAVATATISVHDESSCLPVTIGLEVESERLACGDSVDTEHEPVRAAGFWGTSAMNAGHTIVGDVVKTPSDDIETEEAKTGRQSLSDNSPVRSVVLSEPAVQDSTDIVDRVEPTAELGGHYVEASSPRSNHEMWTNDRLPTVTPCSLVWKDVRLKRQRQSAYKYEQECVLDGVSGSVEAREFLVLTGPSQHETRTLLSCLAGNENAMEGTVTVNGRQWTEKTNPSVAYVRQECLFYETLTVYEHLLFQAQLRMRQSHEAKLCVQQVERVLQEMELLNCRDTVIGGHSLGGITRGERKLLALATAVLTTPSILLVEEPAAGLDTASTELIVTKLRWLAFERGMTVACTLHDTYSYLYDHLDNLYLVADAACVYDGKACNTVAYFSSIGYPCPAYTSPMDYFMLQMVGTDQDLDDVGVARVDTLKRAWMERQTAGKLEHGTRTAPSNETLGHDCDMPTQCDLVSCCGPLYLFWTRHIRRLSRYSFIFWRHFLAVVLIGVAFGLVYLQLDVNDPQGMQNFAGAFFYLVVVQMLVSAYRTFLFVPKEIAIALRERQEYRGGRCHLLWWYSTKIVAELPALSLLSIALVVPVFLLIGIGHGFNVYVYMQIVIILAGWSAVGLAFLTLSVLHQVTLALLVYAVLLACFTLFGGLFINVTAIPDWLVWLHYMSPVNFAYKAMMKLFWKRIDSIACDRTLDGCVARTGESVLTYYSMDSHSALSDTLLLLAICMALFLAALWVLVILANTRTHGFKWRYNWHIRTTKCNEQSGTVRHSTHYRAIQLKSPSIADDQNTAIASDKYYIQVQTPRGRGQSDVPSVTLGWSNLYLKEIDKKLPVEGKPKYLLSNASGTVASGALALLTGPLIESNKALLACFAGLVEPESGKVTLNGVATSSRKLSEHTALVARFESFYETLTLEEHLRFQAQLLSGSSRKCCGTSPRGSEMETVARILDELDLTMKRHLIIRSLSVADKKMLAIATALLRSPSILLSEEPTNGMDHCSSQRVILKLRQLARGGRTIVVTMARPSSHLYALFDSLYLLAEGAAVYNGKVTDAVPYFASLGYQCPQYLNPVDYFVRFLTVRSVNTGTNENQTNELKNIWTTRYLELGLDTTSEVYEAVSDEAIGNRRHVGCWGQWFLLFQRHFLQLGRCRRAMCWHTFWMLLVGLFVGLIFLQLDLDDQQGIQNWSGAFFVLTVLQMVASASRTFIFLPHERTIVKHEYRTFGRYYLLSWYVTRVLSRVPGTLVLSSVLFLPAYLLIGIGHGFELYIFMQIILWLASWSATGLVHLLLGLFRRVRLAVLVYMLLLVQFVVFGGILINVDDVPNFLVWLHYVSPVKYGYEALMKVYWRRIHLLACGDSDGSGSGSLMAADVSSSGSFDIDCIAHSGDEVLAHYSMDKSRTSRSDCFILLGLTVLFFMSGYVALLVRWRWLKH